MHGPTVLFNSLKLCGYINSQLRFIPQVPNIWVESKIKKKLDFVLWCQTPNEAVSLQPLHVDGSLCPSHLSAASPSCRCAGFHHWQDWPGMCVCVHFH